MATEKELDRVLAVELENNANFLEWVVSHTKFANCGATFSSCRVDHPWGSHPFPSVDSTTGESIKTMRQSETDVLLVVSDQSGRLFGLHIENKVGTGKFTNLQPEMYAHRAAHWIGNPRYGGYTDFETVLLAPEVFRQRNTDQAALFDRFISHEAVGHYIPLFQQASGSK
ncbi:hypothetical protein [Xanthomonas arboricola]|uniref:hypothetical protein n=1 Tax=Xanthomonas arboricola TaxID=56448 RepID=UPI00129065C9|nr:hypothetical protein [Xanthomonas arboricola]